RPHNVKVTNIMPGTVETPFFDKANWDANLACALQPQDVASTIVFALQLPDRAVVEELSLQAIQPDACTV
ncbi:MAG: NAD(P)-dependent oxidoreductase, partial [Planctomycetota bacterium]